MKRLIRWFKANATGDQARWRIEPVIAWYDLWIGVYIDREKRIVYVLPLPCIGFRFYWG